METQLMFLDCPAYLDEEGGERSGLPAEVRSRFTINSTDGPLDSAMIRCPAGHWFTGPLESLTLTTEPGRAAALPAITQAGTAAPARPRAAPDADGGKDANNEMARSGPAVAARMVARPQSAAPPL